MPQRRELTSRSVLAWEDCVGLLRTLVRSTFWMSQNPSWQNVLMSHVQNPTTTFHVNMAGFYGDTTRGNDTQRNGERVEHRWGLEILQGAGRLPQVNFYQNGKLLLNPFAQ